MSQKTIMIIIDENGNSSIDLDGFTDNSCGKVFEDFRGGDKVKNEQRRRPSTTRNRSRTGEGQPVKEDERCSFTDSFLSAARTGQGAGPWYGSKVARWPVRVAGTRRPTDMKVSSRMEARSSSEFSPYAAAGTSTA